MYAELASPQCFYQGTSIPLAVAIDLAPIWKLWLTKFSASIPAASRVRHTFLTNNFHFGPLDLKTVAICMLISSDVLTLEKQLI